VTQPSARAHVVRREPDGMFRAVARGLLLLGWCSLLWGTLLCLSLLSGVLSDGPAAALARLDPRGHPGLFPWLNAVCAVFAPMAWISLAGFVFARGKD
jgi:hypothetical protein